MRATTVSSLKPVTTMAVRPNVGPDYADKDFDGMDANYSAEFNKHKINALIGYLGKKRIMRETHVPDRGFVTDLLGANNLAADKNSNPGDAESQKWQQSRRSLYTQEPIIASNEKYMPTATVRRDGSSKFGTNNKWGTFPSVSGVEYHPRVIHESKLA